MACVVLQYFVVNTDSNLLRDEQSAAPDAAATTREAAAVKADLESYERCLLAMARAVETAGMYGGSHPSSIHDVGEWFKLLSSILRVRGTFTVGTDGHVAFVEGSPFSTTNPMILGVLRKLYMTRAGRLELLNGFRETDAIKLAEFLANADESHLAEGENTLESWIERNRLYHVRIKQIRFREVKEGDRVVAGEKLRPNKPSKKDDESVPKSSGVKEVGTWSRRFETESKKAGAPPPIPEKVRDEVAAHLRGLISGDPGDLAEGVMQAAANPVQLSELILKVALVKHELAGRSDQRVGEDVVTCLRSVFDSIQRTSEAQTDEGWANMARMLSVLEEYILERHRAIAGGTDKDEKTIRSGVRDIQRDIEGGALRLEYDQKRSALAAVEHKVRQFFGIRRGKPIDSDVF